MFSSNPKSNPQKRNGIVFARRQNLPNIEYFSHTLDLTVKGIMFKAISREKMLIRISSCEREIIR